MRKIQLFIREKGRMRKTQLSNRKFKWIGLLACMVLSVSGITLPVSAAKHHSHVAEYGSFGITIQGDAYFYNGTRIRIFQDIRPDGSFENSFADRKGTADIRLLRGKNGAVTALEQIAQDEAREILEDVWDSIPPVPATENKKQNVQKEKAAGTKKKNGKKPAAGKKAGKSGQKAGKKGEYTDIRRCEMDEIPDSVQAVINRQCTGSGWYVIQTGSRQYVYRKNLPGDYAWQVSGNNLDVRSIGSRSGSCVLLSLGSGFDFTLSCQGKPAEFQVLPAG